MGRYASFPITFGSHVPESMHESPSVSSILGLSYPCDRCWVFNHWMKPITPQLLLSLPLVHASPWKRERKRGKLLETFQGSNINSNWRSWEGMQPAFWGHRRKSLQYQSYIMSRCSFFTFHYFMLKSEIVFYTEGYCITIFVISILFILIGRLSSLL